MRIFLTILLHCRIHLQQAKRKAKRKAHSRNDLVVTRHIDNLPKFKNSEQNKKTEIKLLMTFSRTVQF